MSVSTRCSTVPLIHCFLITLIALNYTTSLITVEGSSVHIMLNSLINEDTRERGYESLKLLSVCPDDYRMGRDNNKQNNGNKDNENNNKANNKENSKESNGKESDKNRENNGKKTNKNDKEATSGNSKMLNESDTDIDKIRWSRCLVVIEKTEITEITEGNTLEKSVKKEEKEMIKTHRGMPNIFLKKKSLENDKCESKENLFLDGLMPDFRKNLFAATWKGGEIRKIIDGGIFPFF